jgi:hypothetical protein
VPATCSLIKYFNWSNCTALIFKLEQILFLKYKINLGIVTHFLEKKIDFINEFKINYIVDDIFI